MISECSTVECPPFAHMNTGSMQGDGQHTVIVGTENNTGMANTKEEHTDPRPMNQFCSKLDSEALKMILDSIFYKTTGLYIILDSLYKSMVR